MKFLLRLKHWQLFLLTWGFPILLNFFTFSSPELIFKLFPVMLLIFMIGIFGWVWAIATQLHEKLPVNVRLNVGSFKIFFLIPITYSLAITGWMSYIFYAGPSGESGSIAPIMAVVVFLHLLSMVCIFLGLRFAAQTLKSVELGRLAHFGDYAGDFFLIWFSPVGIWTIQPRLNKLMDN